MPKIARIAGSLNGVGLMLLVWIVAAGCSRPSALKQAAVVKLTMMGIGDHPEELEFFRNELSHFKAKTALDVQILPGYSTEEIQLGVFQSLFKEGSSQPDICLIDNVWPGLLAEDLTDLKQYLNDEDLRAFDPTLLDAFTVNGKLLGLPGYIDFGVLYYRSDLLKKYGYSGPPKTWDQLGAMAEKIQAGERRAGKSDFWGYVWQGTDSESLVCNALEWEAAEGGNWISPDGSFGGAGPASERAFARAASWVGRISPASVVEYDEEDAGNVWLAGNAAFLRSWLEVVPMSRQAPAVKGRFATTVLPGGAHSANWVFGGMAFSVSRYSKSRREAAQAVRFLVSAELQRHRVWQLGQIPSRTELLQDGELMAGTPFPGEIERRWRSGLTLRPAMLTGKNYAAISAAYSAAVHKILADQSSPRSVLDDLGSKTQSLLGRPKESGSNLHFE